MKIARIPATCPKPVKLKAGEQVWWCSCGRSKSQPFCDGSHQGTGFEPVPFTADRDDTFFFCQCKRSKTPPFCDGSHKKIPEEEFDAAEGFRRTWYKVAEPGDMQEREVRAVQAGSRSVALTFLGGRYGALDNACPHQGGPLADGSIECTEGDCWLRCPWHGWDFHPLTGESPGGTDDGATAWPVEEREDGVYVQVKESIERARTVSNLVVETMANWGVKRVFGMVGHSNLGLADAVRQETERGGMGYIGIRHEGAAAFACSGYAKLSGRPAACLTIAGPGATNLLTGLWDARADRAPVLALTGQVNTQFLGPGAFQEIDLAAAFSAVAAFSQTVLPGSRHAELVNLALKTATVRRDVAHLILPDEVQNLPAPEGMEPGRPAGRLAAEAIAPPEKALEKALDLIGRSRRPAIIAGFGARGGMERVIELAERLAAPILTTFKAKGQVPDAHPLATGVLGRSGTPVSSWFMNKADLLVVFGASFSNHTGITAKKPIIQVDLDPMMLGRFHAVQLPVWGEIGVTAGRLLERLPDRPGAVNPGPEIAERWRIWREEKARRANRDRGRGLSSAAVFAALGKTCPADAVIAVDVGSNTYAFGRYFESRRQPVLMSGYLGSIGFALPAAIGAWAATEDFEELQGRKVVSISGDGGLGQYLAEFTTLVKYGMGITHVVLNNGELGKISREQRAGSWPVWQTDLVNPGFAAFAENCGGLGLRVERAGELEPALRQALTHPGPSLVEVIIDPGLA